MTTNTTSSELYYKAVGSIVIYFTTVITALVICIVRTRFTASNTLYILIALSSLFTTWYYILSWFKGEYEALGSDLDRFIIESDLFIKAYAIVTNTLPKWWWSSQLLVLTGTALTCWSVEGQSLRLQIASGAVEKRKRSSSVRKWTPTWWFVLLGFFGSMSVGGPLFLAQLDPAPRSQSQVRTVPTILALLILLGEASVIATPYIPTMTAEFKYNLILTHALFLIPSLMTFNPETHKRFWTVRLPTLYFLLAAIALASHAVHSFPFLISPIIKKSELYNALWLNHCQTSISADLIFNNVLAAVYMLQSSYREKKLYVGIISTLAMPLLSVSTVLPLYLGWKEGLIVTKVSTRHKKKA
ncbi:asparagine-linked glycosylation protein [Mortierella sp. NVP85]|nr:asparagine-linked glycosylation protein [Mortierella sp. NVP85]